MAPRKVSGRLRKRPTIAAANAFVYFVRYGVQNWIPTYLETAKGFSFHESSAAWFMFEYAAIPGTIERDRA